MVGEEEQQAELRVFRVPALNFEALWVRYEGEGRDVLVPLHSEGRPAHSLRRIAHLQVSQGEQKVSHSPHRFARVGEAPGLVEAAV